MIKQKLYKTLDTSLYLAYNTAINQGCMMTADYNLDDLYDKLAGKNIAANRLFRATDYGYKINKYLMPKKDVPGHHGIDEMIDLFAQHTVYQFSYSIIDNCTYFDKKYHTHVDETISFNAEIAFYVNNRYTPSYYPELKLKGFTIDNISNQTEFNRALDVWNRYLIAATPKILDHSQYLLLNFSRILDDHLKHCDPKDFDNKRKDEWAQKMYITLHNMEQILCQKIEELKF